MFNQQQQIYFFGQIQTSQTGGHLYSDTTPFEVSECSLVSIFKVLRQRQIALFQNLKKIKWVFAFT